jgi:CHAT domain-containing protein
VFVGKSDDLPRSREEIAPLVSRSDLPVEIHDPCLRADWPNDSKAGIWHYTGHAQMRSDNSFYSSLQLTDGPLFAADFRLKQNQVDLAVLAACRTGQQVYLPGEESSGLVRALLEMGARNVLASHWAVADASTALWMQSFYRSYLPSSDLHISINEAARTVRDRFPSAYHWAAFSLFGA